MSKKSRRNKRKKRIQKMYNKNQNVINNTPVDPEPTGPDYWESDVECITECGKAPDDMCIWIHPIAKEKIEILMEEYTSIEWLAYLIGKIDEKIEVTDIFIPNQEITAASVDNVVCEEYNDLDAIGVIHSHHNMGNSFSHTDDKYINQNHDISLCISNSGIKGHVRWETPCGAYKIIDCTVKVKTESLLDKDDFLKGIKEKIKRKVYTTVHYGGYPGYNYDGYNKHTYNKPGGYINKHIPANVNKPIIRNNLSNILTDVEVDELDNQIEELDFDKEQTVEEEMALMKEMDQLGTDFMV